MGGCRATELGKKIEGARDDNGPRRARQRRARGSGPGARIGNRLDMAESTVRRGRRGPLPGATAHSRTPWRSSVRPRTERASSISSGPLVGEDRAARATYSRSGQPRQEVADAGEVVGAVPDLERLLARGARAGPGSETSCGGVRVDLGAEERLGGRGREREVAAAGDDRRVPAPFSRASSSHSGSPSTTVAARLHDRELLGGDRLARVAEDVHVVERDVREHDDARAQDVRRVVAAAEPGLDDGDVDRRVGEREQRGGGERPRTASPPPACGRTRATARSKSASRAADADPLAPAAHVRREVRADAQARRRRAAPRSSASSSTCRSCRRRARPGSAAADRRAPRAARASAPSRSRPPATG